MVVVAIWVRVRWMDPSREAVSQVNHGRTRRERRTRKSKRQTDKKKKKPMNNGRADEALPRLTVEQKEEPSQRET